MGYLKWGGKKFYPQKPKPYKPDINELMKPLSEKVGKGNVWGSQVMNVLKEESVPVSPTPTPSITPTQTITPTPSVTPTLTPTPSITPTSTVTPTPSVTPTLTPTQTITPTPTNTPTPSSSPIPSGTTEANAYLTAVVDAGGTIDTTISAATRTLFTSLVSNGLYDKLVAIYPYIGGVANSSAINGVNPGTYNITWFGGMTFSNSGATGNGTNGYGETGIDFQTGIGTSLFVSGTIGAYVNDIPSVSRAMIASGPRSFSGTDARALIGNNGGDYGTSTAGPGGPAGYGRIDIPSSFEKGQYMFSSSGTSKNEILKVSSTGQTFFSNSVGISKGGEPGKLYVFRREDGFYFNGRQSFNFVASALTQSEMTTLGNLINTYQTSLNRNEY
jgi:hypothetical protein